MTPEEIRTLYPNASPSEVERLSWWPRTRAEIPDSCRLKRLARGRYASRDGIYHVERRPSGCWGIYMPGVNVLVNVVDNFYNIPVILMGRARWLAAGGRDGASMYLPQPVLPLPLAG